MMRYEKMEREAGCLIVLDQDQKQTKRKKETYFSFHLLFVSSFPVKLRDDNRGKEKIAVKQR